MEYTYGDEIRFSLSISPTLTIHFFLDKEKNHSENASVEPCLTLSPNKLAKSLSLKFSFSFHFR